MLACLAEHLGLVPSTHAGKLTLPCCRRSNTLFRYLQGICTHVVCINSHRRMHTHINIALVDVRLEIQHLWNAMLSHLPMPEDPNSGLRQLGGKACWLLAQGHSCLGRWEGDLRLSLELPCSPL